MNIDEEHSAIQKNIDALLTELGATQELSKVEKIEAKLEELYVADKFVDLAPFMEADAVALASVMGTGESITLHKDESIMYNTPDIYKEQFEQYLKEDKVIKNINDYIIGPLRSKIDTSTLSFFETEKFTQIALVLARNHVISRAAYTDAGLLPSSVKQNAINLLILAGVDKNIIKRQYNIFFGHEPENSLFPPEPLHVPASSVGSKTNAAPQLGTVSANGGSKKGDKKAK